MKRKQERRGRSMKKKVFEVSITKGQEKKHYTQMSPKELEYLQNRLNAVKTVKKSFHLNTNKNLNKLKESLFMGVLKSKDYSIIEYNRTEKNGVVSRRVLVRSNRSIQRVFYQSHKYKAYGKAALCFVIDIDTNTIITAYYNYDKDTHITLDMSRYNEALAII